MANKKYSDFVAATPLSSDILLQADPGTGALTKIFLSQLTNFLDPLATLRGIGSSICGIPFGYNATSAATSTSPSNNTQLFSIVYLPVKCVITSLAFLQKTNGVYTASLNNKLGLYSVAGNTLTLIANTANNGNLYKQGNNIFHAEPLTASVTINPGIYYTSCLYNQSAQTNLPTFTGVVYNYAGTTQFLDVTAALFPQMFIAGQNDLIAANTFAAAAAQTSSPAIMLYGSPV